MIQAGWPQRLLEFDFMSFSWRRLSKLGITVETLPYVLMVNDDLSF